MFSTDLSATSKSIHPAYRFLETASLNDSLAQNEISRRLNQLPRWLKALYEQQFVQLGGASLLQEMYTPLTGRVSLDSKDEPFEVSGPLCEFLGLPKGLLSGLGGEALSSKGQGEASTELSTPLSSPLSSPISSIGPMPIDMTKRSEDKNRNNDPNRNENPEKSERVIHFSVKEEKVDKPDKIGKFEQAIEVERRREEIPSFKPEHYANKRCLLLLGDAGNGKSETLKRVGLLAWQQVMRSLLLLDNSSQLTHKLSLPLWVNLNQVASLGGVSSSIDPNKNNTQPLGLIERQIKQCLYLAGESKETFRSYLKSQSQGQLRWRLLLDGYDEMVTRVNLYRDNRWYESRYEGIKVLISCRTQSIVGQGTYRDWFIPSDGQRVQPALLGELVLQPFGELQKRLTIEHYCLHQKDLTAPWNNPHTYLEQEKQLPGLSELMANPFMLTMVLKVLPELEHRWRERMRLHQAPFEGIGEALGEGLEKDKKDRHEKPEKQEKREIDNDNNTSEEFSLSQQQVKGLSAPIGRANSKTTQPMKLNLYDLLDSYVTYHAERDGQKCAELYGEAGLREISSELSSHLSSYLTLEKRYGLALRAYAEQLAAQLFGQTAEVRHQPGLNQLRYYPQDLDSPWRIFFDTKRYPVWQQSGCLLQVSEGRDEQGRDYRELRFRHKRLLEYFALEYVRHYSDRYYVLEGVPEGIPKGVVEGMKGGEVIERSVSSEEKSPVKSTLMKTESINRVWSHVWLPQALYHHPLNQRLLTEERDFLDLLVYVMNAGEIKAEGMKEGWLSEASFWSLIEASRYREDISILSSNAATVLNRAEKTFSRKLLSNTKLPGADLQQGMFHDTDFRESDVRGMRLVNSELTKANFQRARVEGFLLGQLPGMALGGGLSHFAMDPTGQWLASSSYDKTVRLWSVGRRECEAVLKGHTGRVTSVVFSPDGAWLASSSWDKNVRLCSVATHECKAVLEGHRSVVNSVVFSPDGAWLASGSDDKTIRLWSVGRRECKAVLEGHTERVSSVVFSPNGAWLASSSSDTAVRLWSVGRRECEALLEDHTLEVTSVVFSPDGAWLASSSWDNTVRLWSVGRRTCEAVLEGHIDWVTSVVFSPDGAWLASGSDDKTVRLWSVATRKCKAVFEDHTCEVTSVVFSLDGQVLLSGDTGGVFCRWPVYRPVALRAEWSGHTDSVTSVVFSPDGAWLASISRDKTTRLWSVGRRTCEAVLEGHRAWMTSVVFSPDGAWLASSSHDKTVRLWSVGRRTCEAVLEGHTDSVMSVVFSPDGAWLASGSYDDTVRLWSVDRRECKVVLKGHTNDVTSVVFSPDGAWLASSSDDKTVRLWSVGRRTCEAVLEGHTNVVTSVVFSPDGTWLASSSYDTTVRLLSVDRRTCEAVLEGHRQWVNSLVFSPDGAWLASSSHDETVRLWSVVRRECKAVLEGHTDRVTSVVFSPDGEWLASASDDTTVRLWSVATRECKAVLEGHTNWVNSVVFSPDGAWLASGSYDNTVHLWAPHPQQSWCSPISVWSSHPQFLVSGLDLRGAKGLSLDNRQVFEQQKGKVLLSPLPSDLTPSYLTGAADVSWDGTVVSLTGLLRREREQNRAENIKQSVVALVSDYRQLSYLLTSTQAQLLELMHPSTGYQRLLHLLTKDGPVLYQWSPVLSRMSSPMPVISATLSEKRLPFSQHTHCMWQVLSLETLRRLVLAEKSVVRWWSISRERAVELLSEPVSSRHNDDVNTGEEIQPFTQVWQSTLLSPIQQSKAQQKTLPNYRWQREHKWQYWSDNELLKQMQLGDYVVIEDSQIVNNIRQNTHQSSSITSLFKNTPDIIEIDDNHHFIRVRLVLDKPNLEAAHQRLSNYMASEPFQRARAIDLSHHRLTDTLLISLLRPLGSMTSLECLQLSHNQITEKGLFSLLDALKALKGFTLRQILCDHNHISGDHHTLKKIDQRLKQTTLTNLDLSMNFILKGEVQEGRSVHGKPLKFWHRHGDLIDSHDNHHQTGQGTTKDNLSTRYNSVLFATHQQLNSFYMKSVQSIIEPSRQLTPDKGVVGLYAYKGGSGKQLPSSRFLPQWIPNPFSEHAFLVIEGVHGFGQRFIMMADLYANPHKNNKTGLVQLCHCSPEEYYHRTKALSGNQSSVFMKHTEMDKKEFRTLKTLLMKSRAQQEFINFCLRPDENNVNCLKWAKEMLHQAGLIPTDQLRSWVPSWEVSNRRKIGPRRG